MTGLGNHKSFFSEYANINSLMVSVIDINHFSEINNIFGYDAGDYVLIKIANILKESYKCFKLESDKFLIIHDKIYSDSEIDTYSNYLFESFLKETFQYNSYSIFITISIGIAFLENNKNPKTSLKDLIFNAIYALKYAKNHNLIYSIYNYKLEKHLVNEDNFNWKKRIIIALENNNIIPFYQGIFNNSTKKIEKFEALVRIKEGENYITPNNFLIASKKYRLYKNLTMIMIDNTLKTIMKSDIEMSINISMDDISDNITRRFIRSKLKNFSKPEKIVFELLESEEIENYEKVREFINEVKQFNCKIALDDFGTGYSNFSHLLNLGIDYLKIDASIIQNIDKNKNAEYITKMIIGFAEKIGAKTIAEFVHSKSVYEKVCSLGVNYSQGYYISKPAIKINCSVKKNI